MKKSIILIILIITIIVAIIGGIFLFGHSNSLSSLDSIRKNGKIVMLTEAGFAPYEYIEGSNVVGVDIDIAKEIAKDIGVELKVVEMDFDGIIAAVNSGKGSFGAAGISVTEERKRKVDFSIEYAKSYQVVIVKNDSSIIKNEDINGKIVGVQLGTLGDRVATQDYKTKEVKRYKKYLEALEELKLGRIDAMVLDSLLAKTLTKENTNLKVLETPILEDSYAICVKKGNTSLLQAINNTLKRLISENKIEQFIVNYWKK